jgi:hypothetical protein
MDFESVTTPIPVCTVNVNAGTGNNWTTVSNPGMVLQLNASIFL